MVRRNPCILCGSETAPWLSMPIDPKRRKPTPFGNVVRCSRCSFGSVSPTPEKSEVPDFYDLGEHYPQGIYRMPDPEIDFMDRVLGKFAWLMDENARKSPRDFANMIDESSFVLDIGSGRGERLKEYSKRSRNVFGMEPYDGDPGSGGHRVFSCTAEGMTEDLKAMRFDFISMIHVLEHCIDPVKAIRNIRRISHDGTILWVEVPNAECLHFLRFGICSEMFDAPRHLHFFNTENLGHLLADNGFEILEIYYCGFERHHNKFWRKRECEIFDMLNEFSPEIGGRAVRHTWLKSAALMSASALQTQRKKYDCVGFVCRFSGV